MLGKAFLIREICLTKNGLVSVIYKLYETAEVNASRKKLTLKFKISTSILVHRLTNTTRKTEVKFVVQKNKTTK